MEYPLGEIMASRPRINREEFVDTVLQFQAYLTSNDKWVSEDIPSEFFDSPYEEYIDSKINSARYTMSVWENDLDTPCQYYIDAKEKLEAYEQQKFKSCPMSDTFMDKFKYWIVDNCLKEWKSFLSAKRQKKLKSNRRKKQVTLASDVFYRLSKLRKDLNLSIDDVMIALLNSSEEGNKPIAYKNNITNSHEYAAAQQRIMELKDVHPESYFMSEMKSLKTKSEEFLNTVTGKEMLRNDKRDKIHQKKEEIHWANSNE